MSKCFSITLLSFLSLIIPFCASSFARESGQTPPLNSGTKEVENGQKLGQPVFYRYGDWYYRCADILTDSNKNTVKRCEVLQMEQIQNGDQPITVLSVAFAIIPPQKRGGKPGLMMTSVAPLNVSLREGLRYSILGKDIIHTAYSHCNQAGCWARQLLNSKMLDSLKKASKGEGHYRLATGRYVNIKFSLNGLSAALAAMEKSSDS